MPPLSFFFGTVWDPRLAAAGAGDTGGQPGLIPLLAGTLYIALVAMLVAVPVGLMSAVYMAEYASPKVLAGDQAGAGIAGRHPDHRLRHLRAGDPRAGCAIFPSALPWRYAVHPGAPIFTAGVVMGIMLIPVVRSSLSDDIITAVPRAMRDGSLGLGATRSETIKRVILPAALPGIVGAILLTASRPSAKP